MNLVKWDLIPLIKLLHPLSTSHILTRLIRDKSVRFKLINMVMWVFVHISVLYVGGGVLKNFKSSPWKHFDVWTRGQILGSRSVQEFFKTHTHTLIWKWISYNLACISVYLLIKSDANKRFLLFHSISYMRLKYFVWSWFRYPLISFICVSKFSINKIYIIWNLCLTTD